MNKIKAAIIEDEVPAARLLHEMIQSLRPDWEVMILPGTIEESVEWFRVNPHPELLFLDIQLTDGNSFMLIEQARPDSMIVFTTAYDEYAVRAFAVNSIERNISVILIGRAGYWRCWKVCLIRRSFRW